MNSKGKLEGKFALISGASLGLGKEIARAFLREGASVSICARHWPELKKAVRELKREEGPGQIILAETADVSRPAQIDRWVKTTLKAFPRVDILVPNAGIYGPKGHLEDIDWKDWVKTIEINLFGTVYLCRAALKHFKKRKKGKIILISGGGATAPLPRFSAYAGSKAAVVRFGETLAQEVKEFGIEVNAVAPGPLNTRFLNEVLKAGAQKVGRAFYERALKQKKEGGASVEQAAALCVYLASSDSDGITGKLLSALWDPWKHLQNHLADLTESDIFTLRRIVPKDRGLEWGIK